jgi:hypothetical protein
MSRVPAILAPFILALAVIPASAGVIGVTRECRVYYGHFIGKNASVLDLEDHKDSPIEFVSSSLTYNHADTLLGAFCNTAADQTAVVDTASAALHISGSIASQATVSAPDDVIAQALSESYMYYTFQLDAPATYTVSGTNTDNDNTNQLALISLDTHGAVYLSSFDGGTIYDQTAPLDVGTYQLRIYSKVLVNAAVTGFDTNLQSFNFAIVPIPEPAVALTSFVPFLLRLRRR